MSALGIGVLLWLAGPSVALFVLVVAYPRHLRRRLDRYSRRCSVCPGSPARKASVTSISSLRNLS